MPSFRGVYIVITIKNINLNGKKIETPNLFVSYRVGDYPYAGLKCLPWNEIEIEALLVNSYDFLKSKYRQLLGHHGVNFLKFKGPIMMDSGGFYFIEKKHIDIDPLEILDLELKAKVDIGVVLDHPVHLKATNPYQRAENTLKNTRIMFEELSKNNHDHFILLPVIQGYDIKLLNYFMNRLNYIMRRYNGGYFDYVGIGGLVPLSQRRDERIVNVISYIRKNLPDAYIHCFSLGSPLMMLIAFYCGADTVDTQGWIKSAAFRAINLPGMGSVNLRLKDKEDKPELFERNYKKLASHLEYLEANEGFKSPYSLDDLIDAPNERRIHNRAMHNLYVYVYESQKAREAIKGEYFEEFLEERFSRSKILGKLFEKAKEMKKCGKIYS